MSQSPTAAYLVTVLLCLVGIVLVMAVVTSCESPGSGNVQPGYYGEPELVVMAEDASARLALPPLTAVDMAWGSESQCWPDRIEIDRGVRGTKWARVHVEHEILELQEWWGTGTDATRARLDREHGINR